MEFKDLNLDKRLLDAITEQGYVNPSPIQEQAIPPALLYKDILGCAQTGTGKTASFALPILQRLLNTEMVYPRKIKSLIMTPTRELALQIYESFVNYGKNTKFKYGVIMGGVSQVNQVKTIKNGIDVLIATPGRLLDLINQKAVDLKDIEVFVLDEADRMLDMGFIHDVKKVITFLPKKKQTLFFTATMPSEIMKLATSLLIDPVNVTVTPVSSTVDKITQSVYMVDKAKKPDLLVWLLKNNKEMLSTLVFSKTKHGANKLTEKLAKANIQSFAIHGYKSQTARQFALDNFKSGKVKVLVATDIAARGIDIEHITHVINFDLPDTEETYVHRIGRTGRAGRNGISFSFCDIDEVDMLKSIEKLIKKKIDVTINHPYPMVVLEKTPPKSKQRNNFPKGIPSSQNKQKSQKPSKNKFLSKTTK